MGALVESVCTQAIEEAETDKRFEDESVEAWQRYMKNGVSIDQGQINARFEAALTRARQVAAGASHANHSRKAVRDDGGILG